MRLTLRAKVILTVSLFLVALFALIMYLSLTRNTSQLRSSLNEQSKSFAALATPPIGNVFLLYQDSGSIRINQQVDKFLELDPDVTAVRIVSVDGKQLYNSQGRPSPPLKSSLAASFQPQYLKNESGYINEVIQPFFEDSGAHRYAVVYEISTQRAEQSTRDAVRLVLYVGLIILAFSIAATIWALNVLIIKPLREVSRSANIISAGNYGQQIVSKSHDEIGNLAESVNTMARSLTANIEKLQGLDKLKSEFLMIASHNLRTPLTVMRGYIEMAEQATTADELKAIIKTIQESVVRLHLLSEDLLTISTLESGGEMLSKSPTEAKHFLEATVSEFALLAEKKRLRWQFTNDIPDGVKLNLSQSNMRSALGNLLDNAIKFTKEDGSIAVTAVLDGQQLVFTVTDTGIGITTEEMPQLFTMFHRGTGTMHYDYEGAGIGLYLTKLIVEKHGGHIEVKSEIGHGSTFTVSLPLMPNADSSLPPAPADRHPDA
jgi:signal transduction histidine kinase